MGMMYHNMAYYPVFVLTWRVTRSTSPRYFFGALYHHNRPWLSVGRGWHTAQTLQDLYHHLTDVRG